MNASLGRAIRRAILAAGVILYPLLAYYSAATSAATKFPSLGVAVSLAPPLAILLGLAWRSHRRLPILLVGIGLVLLLRWCWDTLERNFDWVYFLQHAGIQVGFALVFGLTLLPGQQPLCTRVAEVVRGSLEPEVIRYTREITLAWSCFFLAISLLSSALFLFSSIQVWSVFANFLTFPLILLMFAVEHWVRLRKLPHLEHTSIRVSLMAYWKTPKPYQDATVPTR
ncbi:MAG: hypothetical protein WAT23_19315 [Chromatiaceae bacterium]